MSKDLVRFLIFEPIAHSMDLRALANTVDQEFDSDALQTWTLSVLPK